MTNTPANFPLSRPRRLRRSAALRGMVRETVLRPEQLIYPLFVSEVVREPVAISSMPGQFQWPVSAMARQAEHVAQLGITAVLLFGIPATKDATGSGAWNERGGVQQAIRAMKAAVPDLVVMTDVCLCEYTDHGHCGVLQLSQDGRSATVDNDATLELLAREALTHADAGADVVAPSDMMDGRVGALRQALDGQGFTNTALMAYSAKYASAFYGPFREAAESAPQVGDRRSYQMDPANGREALREVDLDVAEGADIIMVKPATLYLDVLARVRDRLTLPVAAYHVSGEFAMLKAAAHNGWLDERRATLETLTSIARAGADLIITYTAPEAVAWLGEEG
jgi:porphobilinogen synthase